MSPARLSGFPEREGRRQPFLQRDLGNSRVQPGRTGVIDGREGLHVRPADSLAQRAEGLGSRDL